MRTVSVQASKSYDITIGEGLLSGIGEFAVVVTDDTVAALYGKYFSCPIFVFTNGEQSKTIETLASLLNFLAEYKVTRNDTIAALGGGGVGDLTGFAAACYMRGIKFAQIPTTLLAMVDSSVGGKTGINLPAGKNLAGAFHQPEAVFCDISTLGTLSDEIFHDGCAEIIKYGVLADRKLFDTPIRENLENVIARCVEIKRDIVSEDEFETGKRKLLNFGHTVGHAIEKVSGYTITHGCAVAAGMAIVARASGCRDAPEIVNMLERYHLPTNTIYSAKELAEACLSDKKRDGGYITMIFPERIGKCVLKDVPVSELESLINRGLEE
jgi:3-dehydroquinate synthase